ncbi:retrotransposon protein, putative, Ty3-gypsy subclass [Panicum miliaceum]|uniref:Retrotransposon protein, putative, Ty3-gypsy subclass n=1 Tax=Panicum miliaceum TaxID=4540 RepID=A0A3L6R1H1_PANMI|nr:retrotransposon protein, putative, Ty3-gypsy subclass [Panicum miliaceum]
MHKQCPIHPKLRHTLFECVTIRKSLNAPPLNQAGKRKDKEDDEGGDKSGAQDFQDPYNVVNVIFGGDDGFPTKRAQKLTLREIHSVEPATTRPLRYSEDLLDQLPEECQRAIRKEDFSLMPTDLRLLEGLLSPAETKEVLEAAATIDGIFLEDYPKECQMVQAYKKPRCS